MATGAAPIRSALLALGLALGIATSAAATMPALITNLAGRQTTSLDGDWHAIVDPYETGYYDYRRRAYDQQSPPSDAAYFRNHHPRDRQELVEYDFDASPTLKVPGDWNSQRPELLYYEGTVWLRRLFDAAAVPPGRRVFVHFGAVHARAEVYLNGHKLGTHEGGFTPFNFEITRLLQPRGNFLVVKVDNTRRPEAVPTTSTDWWNYGGITRSVTLIEEPAAFVRDHVLQLKKGHGDVLAGKVQMDGATPGEAVSVAIPELGLRTRVSVDAQGQARYELAAPGLQPWSPESPKLYEVVLSTATQTLRESIGFRRIEARGSQLLLNGRPLYLRGISIHEENPLEGRRAHSEADDRQLLGWAQALGCNFVRLAHYPHNEHMVRLADRMGLLVWAEIPVYWTIDFDHPHTQASASQQLTEMITRDRNRASVILWSVGNETPPGPARHRFLSHLIGLARELDATRLLTAALETHDEGGTTVVSDPIGEQLDVVSFNQYRGWYGGTLHDAPQARWDLRFDKPAIVSEFGGDARQGLRGPIDQRWTEDYQDYLYQQNLAMIGRIPSVRGMSPWILADFRSPRRPLPGIQDGWNRKGLISSDGVRKLAFERLRRHYEGLARQPEATQP